MHRLRNLLHQGKLDGYYFENNGRHIVPRDFWATAQADGVVELGIYWPFGEPSRVLERRPNYALFLLQSELNKLLSDEPAKKRPFPRSRIPDLVAALRKLEALPNRRAQYQDYASCRNFASSRSRTLISAKRQDIFRAIPAANRGGIRDAIRYTNFDRQDCYDFRT